MSRPLLLQRLSLPVIGSPLFIISNPDLVIAQCKAGIVGSFPALNARPAPLLGEWLQRITVELREWDTAHPDTPSAPFAVNQIVHKSNDRLMHDLELCVKYKAPVVITSLGAREDVNAAIHSYGGGSEAKAWKDIWGCGQGIGAVRQVLPAADLVARLAAEYRQARARLRASGQA